MRSGSIRGNCEFGEYERQLSLVSMRDNCEFGEYERQL